MSFGYFYSFDDVFSIKMSNFVAWKYQSSFILAPLLLVVDTIIYYPFFRAYDKQLVEREALVAAGMADDEGDAIEAPTTMTVASQDTFAAIAMPKK